MTDFAREVVADLSANPPTLSSKWFYDARGDELFQAIMGSPEYYLTDCEREIFAGCGPELLRHLGDPPFDLVELGAGDGSKTRLLIDAFLAAGRRFAYRPIDISGHALSELGRSVAAWFPDLDFRPQEGEYFRALDRLDGSRPRLVLFPGANVGNFSPEDARGFLSRLRSFLRPGDLLLTGFDLRKDPATILAAYNDPGGHTAAFNLNLLSRINRELGGDFDLANWLHWETYDPRSGAARSYLVSRKQQTVTLADLDRSFVFEPHQAISVEISQKYSRAEIAELARTSGYEHVAHFTDGREWFVDSLWRVGS